MIDKNIIAGAPTEEPARQQYFMEQVKKLVEAESAKKGRPLTCFINTFGCQMNARDSEKLLGILKEAGYVEGADENSDFVLYNTCTVRENANLKVYGRLGYLSGVKRKNPDMMIALCGCMMQEPEVVAKIKKSYRHVDLIFGTHNIFKLAELLYERFMEKKMVVDVWEGTNEIVEELRSRENIRSSPASISCSAAITSAVTASCRMCADARGAESRRTLSKRSKSLWLTVLWK